MGIVLSPPPAHVELGRLTRELVEKSVWRNRDEFPSCQPWADELERALLFLEGEGQLERFMRRLTARERDATLAEVWAAHFFHINGFSITEWEPESVPGVPGDLEISLDGTPPVFAEVKCPGWQGELEADKRTKERKSAPKYTDGEMNSFDNATTIIYSVKKALPKFCSSRANIVVVVDNLFVSPALVPDDSIFDARFRRLFSGTEFDHVSGVFMLRPVLYLELVEYLTLFVKGRGCPLPSSVECFLDK